MPVLSLSKGSHRNGLAIARSPAIMRHQIHEVEMAIPKEITRLLERYDAQREAYESGQYKETERPTTRFSREYLIDMSRPLSRTGARSYGIGTPLH